MIELEKDRIDALSQGFNHRLRLLKQNRDTTVSNTRKKIYKAQMEELALMIKLLGVFFYEHDTYLRAQFYITSGVKFK